MKPPAFPVSRVPASRLSELNLASAAFSSVCSDHMVVAEHAGAQWRNVEIRPFGPLPLPPSISSLQYGVSVFEGLKVQRSPRGEILLFRVRDNWARLNRSAARLAMPDVPEEIFLDGLRQLLRIDEAWVPPSGDGALYVRPCLFSIDPSVRVKPAERFLFVIFTFPFAAYFPPKVDVWVADRHVRAYPGGTGDVKAAGNYAPGLVADREAASRGFQSVLWIDGRERRYIEECGVMNVFFHIEDEWITPALEGTILAGITRASAIQVLRDEGARVVERRLSIDEVFDASARGHLKEAFGTGTAATLSNLGRIRHGEREISLPDDRPMGELVRVRLNGIATGRMADPHAWIETL
jgi:branched-chain amino acid aminotransferase